MRVNEWWEQLRREFAALAAEDSAFESDEQFKIISLAIAEGVQLSGGPFHPFQDRNHGKNIQRIMAGLKGLNSLPVIIRTDDAAYKRSMRLISIYLEHLKRYDAVHREFNSVIKTVSFPIIDLDKTAQDVIDNIAHLKQQLSEEQKASSVQEQETSKLSGEVKIEAKQAELKQKPEERKSQRQIITEVSELNNSINHWNAVLLILLHDAEKVRQRLQLVAATFWVKLFSTFNSKTPQQKKLERIQAGLTADLAKAKAKIHTKREKRQELCRLFAANRDIKRSEEKKSCSIEAITHQVKDWNGLDDASRAAVKKMLTEVFAEEKPDSYDNQADIGTALAEKIQAAIYRKYLCRGHGVRIETLGYFAKACGHFVGEMVLSHEVFKAVFKKVGKRELLPEPQKIALVR